MALFIRQDENRSQLQERLASELQERARKNAEKNDLPDGVTDSQFLKNTKVTTSFAWLWTILLLVLVGAIIWLTISSAKG